MIQPKLFAQLGNQCFMISAAIAHALKMGTTYSIPKKTISPKVWRTYFTHLPEVKSATKNYYKEKRHCYDPLPEVDSLTIEGYFQSEKYWHGYKKEIAEALGFHKQDEANHHPYVALHIRRGDYLKYPDQFPVLTIKYYNEAIGELINKGFDRFRIYTDDNEWVKNNLQTFEWYNAYVQFNFDTDPLTAMRDMHNADAFIIANSTFSLFPALLRPDNPIVVTPTDERWFGPAAKHLETHDLMPKRFIKM